MAARKAQSESTWPPVKQWPWPLRYRKWNLLRTCNMSAAMSWNCDFSDLFYTLICQYVNYNGIMYTIRFQYLMICFVYTEVYVLSRRLRVVFWDWKRRPQRNTLTLCSYLELSFLFLWRMELLLGEKLTYKRLFVLDEIFL